MVFFLTGFLMGCVFLWLATWDTRAKASALSAENAELTRALGAKTWADKSILDELDLIAPPRGFTSNQR